MLFCKISSKMPKKQVLILAIFAPVIKTNKKITLN